MRYVYYGTTRSGARIHLGDTIIDQSQNIVASFCGVDVRSYDNGVVPPKRVSELCRNCFRALAWEVFEEKMRQLALELEGARV